MMNRKFATIAVLAGAALMWANAGYSSHRGKFEAHLIGGKIYWYSINFEELIKKITGSDLKAGTFVSAELKILSADSACSNPQTHVINPGQGPKGTAFGSSPQVNDDNLVRSDKVLGNVYQTTASVINLVPDDMRLNPPAGICKDAPGASQWQVLFWQDRNCDKGKAPGDLLDPICYKEFAAFGSDGFLRFVTGPFAGSVVANKFDWTFVYLPTLFKFKVDLIVGPGSVETNYGSCQFPLNPSNGQPYGITNPPAGGWAALPRVEYTCVPIPSGQY